VKKKYLFEEIGDVKGCELDEDLDYAVIEVKDCQDLSAKIKHKMYSIDNYNKDTS
jgi:hypothetical protein